MEKNLGSLQNVFKSLHNPRYAKSVFQKIIDRCTDVRSSVSQEYEQWLANSALRADEYMRLIDPEIWLEAEDHHVRMQTDAELAMQAIGVSLGGAGDTRLLYWLIRKLRPTYILETGVAAGFSSHSILSAIEVNGTGDLFSSDLPYVRLDNPEQYIGLIVPAVLRSKWHLYIDGDLTNLPKILASVPEINFFHYDSDKRYAGRQRACSLILPKLADNGVIVMDDIGDNEYFRNLTAICADRPFWVFQFENKYIGMLGKKGGSNTLQDLVNF